MKTNPIHNDNRLKLGLFCTNGRRGGVMTLVPEASQMDWKTSVKTAQMADDAGFEAIVPFARWKGYIDDQPNHVSGDVMDTFTWAAGIAQATRQVGVFVTAHAPTMHPVLAAKQTATIDLISDGRLGINVVGGWNKPELEMFGAPLKEHDQRYEHLAEWLGIVESLWTRDEEIDVHGRFFDVVKGISIPKPVQKPRPPVMNAGGSDRGMRFACEHADMCFVIVQSERQEHIRGQVDTYKKTAREEFGREVTVWTYAFVVQRDTQKEAEDYFRRYAVEQQDVACADAWMDKQRELTKLMPPAVLEGFRTRFAAGAGGFPLVGTAEQIADRLELLSGAGIDGVLLIWVDYVDGITRFAADVLPRLESSGLRKARIGSRQPAASGR